VEGESIRVEVLQAFPKDKSLQLLVAGRARLTAPLALDTVGRVVVPDNERRMIESRVEHLAHVAAVATHARLRLSSPPPFIALRPESPEDETALRRAMGIALEPGAVQSVEPKLGPALAFRALSDRLDGAAILADAVGNEHPTGMFLGAMRLFERAFARGPETLREPLASFLESSTLGYTGGEVAAWAELRPLATHADRRPQFALEGDLRAPALRMQQAAYDVVFNKRTWRDRSIDRRDSWTPMVGTTSVTSDAFLTRGYDFRPTVHVLDGFSVWPMDLAANLSPHLSVLVPGVALFSPTEVRLMKGTLNVRNPRCLVKLAHLRRCEAITDDASSRVCEAHRLEVARGTSLINIETDIPILLT
jgi:hypothetical protein